MSGTPQAVFVLLCLRERVSMWVRSKVPSLYADGEKDRHERGVPQGRPLVRRVFFPPGLSPSGKAFRRILPFLQMEYPGRESREGVFEMTTDSKGGETFSPSSSVRRTSPQNFPCLPVVPSWPSPSVGLSCCASIHLSLSPPCIHRCPHRSYLGSLPCTEGA